MAEIPPDILAALQCGELATVNLVEYLAVDPGRLLQCVCASLGVPADHPGLLATQANLSTLKPMQRHWAIARFLSALAEVQAEVRLQLAQHTSDIVRAWAALDCGFQTGLSLAERLAAARPFAADGHFGVREMAWLGVRQVVAADLAAALQLLQPWVLDADANVRRFASELTRPRGVWCIHLEALKTHPGAGLDLLEPLRADPSRYVQDSVGNWLNDASKSQPVWTQTLCRRWLLESPGKATEYICRRALRSVKKDI